MSKYEEFKAALEAVARLESDLRSMRDYGERGNRDVEGVLYVSAQQEMAKVQAFLDEWAARNHFSRVRVIEGGRG